MPKSNLSGEKTQFERVLVPVDSYEGAIRSMSDPFEGKNFDPKKQPIEKRRLEIAIQHDKTEKIVTKFFNNVITKGSGTFSSSALYEFIETMGLMEEYMSAEGELSIDDNFTVWINEKTNGKKVKLTTKTVNKGDKERQYSVVDSIIKVLN